jgi:hypothetical protein
MSWLKILCRTLGLETNKQIRDGLKAQLEVEERRATEKIADRNYWRNVGDIERAAVLDIEAAIAGVPDHLSPKEYRDKLTRELETVAEQWRVNVDDEDGYGIATVHAVGRILSTYDG